jgi:large subunit ribosomal protein L15
MVRRHERKWKKYLASRTWGAGNTKNRRNKGSRGGKGYAGSHKHRWLYIVTHEPEHFSGKGFSPILKARIRRKKHSIINVGDIAAIAAVGKLEKKEGAFQFEFKGKVLGGGKIDIPIVLKASEVSESAKKKIEEAGGKVILPSVENVKQ